MITLLALALYILAYILLYTFHLVGSGYLFIFYLLIVVGIIISFKGTKVSDSSRLAKILLILGILSLFYTWVLEIPILMMIDSII